MIPKINLLYYKNILDLVLIRFFEDYNDFFTKVDDLYVFSKTVSLKTLENIFKKYIIDELKKYVSEFDLFNPKYYLIIGACQPINNMLLQYKDDKHYFPKKLHDVINSGLNIKYILKEQDIKIDIELFNTAFIDIFNHFFTKRENILKEFGNNYKSLFFISHNRIDCYTMFKVIKTLYGKTNCVNIYKEQFKDNRIVIVAINDMIDQYIQNKGEMNKSNEFQLYIKSIKSYIDQLMSDVMNNRI